MDRDAPFIVVSETCLKAQDGAAIRGRTLEFGFPLKSNVIVVPAGQEFSGSLPDNGKGLTYKTRYDIAAHLDAGTLVEVAASTPPTPQPFSCLYPHKRLQDPKIKLFIDHVIRGSRAAIEQVAASTSSGKI